MKKQLILSILVLIFSVSSLHAQENQTFFKNNGIRRSGGYAAISNKFTSINGNFANMPGLYGGWFVNRKWMIGAAFEGTTNFIQVPSAYKHFPADRMTYQYGQAGLMTEYVVASTRLVHVNFNLMTGTGFTLQYDRREIEDWDFDNLEEHKDQKPNFFFVMEPGVQVEFNLFKWMRFSPGVSYRRAFGAKGDGLSDADLSNISYNLTLKFGKF
jgi:hypothetical protein